MNEYLQTILEIANNSAALCDEEKNILLKAVKDTDNELNIAQFKLDRTEKVKRTTGILLEETIEELEQKRKAVEEQAEIIKAENERKSIELEEARQLQIAMLPEKIPQVANLRIAAYLETATEVGGDYYDFHVTEDGILTVVIGDATGHGMKAGTMVTITKSLFNNLAAGRDILKTFRRISSVIRNMKLKRLSMCLSMLKLTNNHLTFSSAAMPPMYIYKNNTSSIEEVSLNSMPLGAMNNFPYTIEERELERGDVILLTSDGFPELLNEDEEMLGYDNLKKLFLKYAHELPKKLINGLIDEGIKWAGEREPDDDVTFVVIKVR